MNNFFSEMLATFYSTSFTQKFLQQKYERQNIVNAKAKSYQNTATFIAYVENGELFLQQAEKSVLQVQPVLIFYGLVHLIKACVITIDADYPKTTAVMAHGVSTRKKKRVGYEFILDEVKIQKNGLFLHAASTMFELELQQYSKFTMKKLLAKIEEMRPLFNRYQIETTDISSGEELPEILAYYLLLYNLSMIARYETDWWSDLIKNMPHFDYVFITKLLKLVLQRAEAHTFKWIMN